MLYVEWVFHSIKTNHFYQIILQLLRPYVHTFIRLGLEIVIGTIWTVVIWLYMEDNTHIYRNVSQSVHLLTLFNSFKVCWVLVDMAKISRVT